MIERYKHTQVGYMIIAAMAAVMVLIGFVLTNAGINWIAIGVLVVIAVALVLFSRLTVVIRGDELEARFGPGLIRKQFKLNEIESCQVVKNQWYYGWGIRLTPHGWLFNVSGFHAVEIKLRTGKKFRIGTDVPQELEGAIRQAINVSPR
ncbi:MAG: hypothetical protein ABH839_03700 [Chloroflexota bacterium]